MAERSGAQLAKLRIRGSDSSVCKTLAVSPSSVKVGGLWAVRVVLQLASSGYANKALLLLSSCLRPAFGPGCGLSPNFFYTFFSLEENVPRKEGCFV